MQRKLSGVIALTAALVLGLAGPARAEVTIGSTTQPSGSEARPCQGAVIAPETTDPATPFSVPSPGVILQWRVDVTGATPGTAVTLVVLRHAGSTYTVTAVDPQALPNPLPAGNVASFSPSAAIPVAAGDLIGLFGPASGFDCYWQHGSTPAADSLVALGTTSPAVGQTLSVTDESGPTYVLNLAATLGPVPTTKAKCKKHKKHKRSAASAKKKKCKKKKKR